MRSNFALKLLAIALLLTALFGIQPPCVGDELEIKGDGSTFAYPMYEKWIEEYGKVDPRGSVYLQIERFRSWNP